MVMEEIKGSRAGWFRSEIDCRANEREMISYPPTKRSVGEMIMRDSSPRLKRQIVLKIVLKQILS